MNLQMSKKSKREKENKLRVKTTRFLEEFNLCVQMKIMESVF